MKQHTCTSRMLPRENEGTKQPKTIAAHYGDWLNTMEWDFYCTFTTRYTMSMRSAINSMDRLNNFLAQQYGSKTYHILGSRAV